MSAEVIKAGQLEIRYLVDGSATAGLGVFELTVPPGAKVPPPHSHRDNEEFFYVVEGRLFIDLEGRTVDLAPRQGFVVPKGVLHRTRAAERTVMLMVENAGIIPTGD